MEHLTWQVCHVAVHKDKKRLNDTRVGGEAWGEGSQDPIDSPHKNTTQRHNQEGDDSKEAFHHRHCAFARKLLKEMVEHLDRGAGRELKKRESVDEDHYTHNEVTSTLK